jgi:hypothetical protein
MNKFSVNFSEKNLTGNAGLINFGRFAEKLQLKKIIDDKVTIERAGNADYSISDIVTMLMMGAIAGAKHMIHLDFLKTDHILRKLFNWKVFPHNSTFSRIFKLFNWKHCNELSEAENVIRKKVWDKKGLSNKIVILDLDSEVDGVYGHQEGAEVGYNPKKKGQKAYHPLLCFINATRECLHSWFRCGSAYSANGVVEFMKECKEKLPNAIRKVIVRGDSAFFRGDLLTFLEENGYEYAIKVKMKGLGQLLWGKLYSEIKGKPGYSKTEFLYQCHGWKEPRRFVAIRKYLGSRSEGLLFPIEDYEFFCYVTNMKISPWGCHKFYGKRAASENWIEWCKNQMAAGNILTDTFWANSAIFQTCIMAYNLIAWSSWLTMNKRLHEEPDTIRNWLVHVPGRLLTSGRQLILKLSQNYFFKERWLAVERNILALQL